MSRRGQSMQEAISRSPEPAAPVVATTPSKSDSQPVGLLRLSGIVKTKNGFAVATVSLTPEEWEAIHSRQIGRSQRFKEHIAVEHKMVVLKYGQLA